MPWCPKCKNEYVEGITKCADCGSDLVEELPQEEDIPQKSGDEFFRDMMLLQEEEAGGGAEETDDDETGDAGMKGSARVSASRGVYKNNAQKAADFKDSGYTLIGVGVVGIIAMLLIMTGALPFHLGGVPYLTCGVMTALFIIFLIIGIRSMRSAGAYKKEALTESSLKEEIMGFCRSSLTAEKIDEEISGEGLSLEERYFKRTDYMKEKISRTFINLDEGFLDSLVDEFYPELFEE